MDHLPTQYQYHTKNIFYLLIVLNEHLNNSKHKIYFLCDIDIDWEDDPLREHPNTEDRFRLFNDYKSLLEKYNLNYHVISGDIPTRIKKCKEIIDTSI